MRLVPTAAAAAAALLALGVAAPSVASSTTVVVNETNIGVDWSTADTRPGGSLAFSPDLGAPAGLGSGSLQLSTVDGAAKVQLFTQVDDVPLAELDTAAFWTYRSPASTAPAVQTPAINAIIDYNGDAAGGFATLVFEPYYTYGVATPGQWHSWSANGEAKWWSTRAMPGVASAFDSYVALDDILAANPDATISAFGVNQGSGNPDLLAAVDGLTVGGTTYDFEPRVFTKADCKDGGWATNFAADTFVNQGDCVSFYASQGRTHAGR